MSIVLALLGALAYGGADFAGGLAARRAPALAVVLCGQAASLAVVALVLLVSPGRLDAPSIGWGLAAGVVGGLALLRFYRSLAVGAMSVVAPLTAVLSALVPVAGGLVLGERPSPVALVGVLLAAVAVLLVSAEQGRPPGRALLRSPGVAGALLAGAGFGLMFVLLSRSAPDTGFWPVAAARIASVVLLGTVALLSGRGLLARGAPPALVVASGVGDLLANVLFVLASRLGLLSIVGVLLALYPAATVLLALLVLRERLHAAQVVGLGVAATGVALIALS